MSAYGIMDPFGYLCLNPVRTMIKLSGASFSGLSCLLAIVLGPIAVGQESKLPTGVSFKPGAINSVLLERDGERVAIYGWDEPVARCLLTEGRRDVIWHAAEADHVTAPIRSRYLLEKGEDFWTQFATARYHDYAQQTTKAPDRAWAVERWVSDGDRVTWKGGALQVLETPGYTRDAASYITEIAGKRIGFTGNLMYAGGKLWDLYSFQDAIPDAQIRGYHGYGARLADLVTSLDKIIAADLDIAIPCRGPIIDDPTATATLLKQRVQAIYHNYLSTNALHWYFKKERMTLCGERVLGKGAEVELMPYCRHEKTPDWIYENSTSRLLISESGRGFLLDCGNQRVIDGVQQLIEQGAIEAVDGIFVTHFHDDHTDSVQAAAKKFSCPVYATEEYADVLERPSAYHLPAMTANPIRNVKRMKSGQTMKWHEFQLTFHFFPGQAYHHGALFVEKKGARPVFFIGDAFAPSGIDDYCLLNRNLLHDDEGYLLCLKKVRAAGDCWLINEHIQYVFEFNAKELDYLESRYRKRRDMLAELFPWDDPNYGVDEQWGVFYPRGLDVKAGQTVEFEFRIANHSPRKRSFQQTPHLPKGVELVEAPDALVIDAHDTGAARLRLKVGTGQTNWRVITMDVDSEGMSFKRWADACLTVK